MLNVNINIKSKFFLISQEFELLNMDKIEKSEISNFYMIEVEEQNGSLIYNFYEVVYLRGLKKHLETLMFNIYSDNRGFHYSLTGTEEYLLKVVNDNL